jgi:hypothetical protein
VGGVSLGDSTATVLAVLGKPEHRQQLLGFVTWEYPTRGLTLMWDRDQHTVRVMVVVKRRVGAVAGVRVGDPSSVARAEWGEPVRVRQDGRFLDFLHPAWAATAEVVKGKIVEITMQRAE